MTPEPGDPENEPGDQQPVENPADVSGNIIHATPSRGGGKATSSSVSQSRVQTESLKLYNAGDMAGPISVDLEGAQQCKAAEMIKFLLAFCRSGNDKTVPVHDDRVLQRAFEETRKLANHSETPLQTQLQEFRSAKNELDMYKPFVLACNYALDRLSEIEVEGLPPFEPEKQIVFVHSSNQSMKGTTHWRDPQVKPDIVLIQWDVFVERLSTRLSNRSKAKYHYSDSYSGDLCILKSSLDLSWRVVRSTVEMKIRGLPKRTKLPMTFGEGFETLKEAESSTSSVDDVQPAVTPEMAPALKYASRSSERLSKMKPPVTSENFQMSSNTKRRLEAVVRDDDEEDEDEEAEEPPNKRVKGQGSKNPPRNRGDSGNDTTGSSKTNTGGLSQKHPVNVQNAIYAAERLSCSFDTTHSINFILLGSTIYITWSDRQNVIRTGGFDIVDDLPHFLLVLLILQRFDLARWGIFTEFPDSSIRTIKDKRKTYVLKATFMDEPVDIYPEDHPVYDGINLAGRSTSIAGARTDSGQTQDQTSSKDIRKANDLVAKFSWPEESRVSEVTFIQRAEEIGKTNGLVEGHIPTVIGSIDPPHLTCSTSLIRQFLGLDTNGARVLRVIVFQRLQEIKYLDEEDMLIAFLDCFFCHWALWEKDVEHGDISIGNLMCDPVTKRGVLNDFDLAREGGPNRRPSAKDNTGTVPFLALDLLNKRAFNGLVQRRYRHDAESFAWCLIYICICMGKDEKGRIGTIKPHPLSSWFTSIGDSYHSKTTLSSEEFLKELPLHKATMPLAVALHDYWVARYNGQLAAERSTSLSSDHSDSLKEFIPLELVPKRKAVTMEPYREPSDFESFKQVLRELIRASDVVPKSKQDIFLGKLQSLLSLYSIGDL